MLWLKAFHVIAVVTWFAGLFYLPRLFVYHADATDAVGISRFKVMENRLFAIMSIGGTASVLLGIAMLVKVPAYVTMLWLLVKLCIVLLVIVYHSMCFKYLMDFRHDRNVHSSRWFRGFNEIPSVLLVAIVILAVVKPF
jgi:putative membrane protein